MVDVQIVGDRAAHQEPCGPVGVDLLVIHAEQAVAIRQAVTCPEPAATVTCRDAAQESG
jgi:hypothetical protein